MTYGTHLDSGRNATNLLYTLTLHTKITDLRFAAPEACRRGGTRNTKGETMKLLQLTNFKHGGLAVIRTDRVITVVDLEPDADFGPRSRVEIEGGASLLVKEKASDILAVIAEEFTDVLNVD